MAWPTDISALDQGRALKVVYDDGVTVRVSAEKLRVESPSAEVRGHSPAERKTVGGKRHVKILRVEPVGNYAVRLVFDDGHDTGIYTWDALYKLGAEQASVWQAYLTALAEKGLDRDRAGQK